MITNVYLSLAPTEFPETLCVTKRHPVAKYRINKNPNLTDSSRNMTAPFKNITDTSKKEPRKPGFWQTRIN